MKLFDSFEMRRPPPGSLTNYTDANTVFIDESRLGTRYAEVTPIPAPEPSSVELMAAAGFLASPRRGWKKYAIG